MKLNKIGFRIVVYPSSKMPVSITTPGLETIDASFYERPLKAIKKDEDDDGGGGSAMAI